jgi:hypothetical protein
MVNTADLVLVCLPPPMCLLCLFLAIKTDIFTRFGSSILPPITRAFGPIIDQEEEEDSTSP